VTDLQAFNIVYENMRAGYAVADVFRKMQHITPGNLHANRHVIFKTMHQVCVKTQPAHLPFNGPLVIKMRSTGFTTAMV
jgi:hypothetical protein